MLLAQPSIFIPSLTDEGKKPIMVINPMRKTIELYGSEIFKEETPAIC